MYYFKINFLIKSHDLLSYFQYLLNTFKQLWCNFYKNKKWPRQLILSTRYTRLKRKKLLFASNKHSWKYYFYIFFLNSFLIFFVHSMLSELQSMQEKTKKNRKSRKTILNAWKYKQQQQNPIKFLELQVEYWFKRTYISVPDMFTYTHTHTPAPARIHTRELAGRSSCRCNNLSLKCRQRRHNKNKNKHKKTS